MAQNYNTGGASSSYEFQSAFSYRSAQTSPPKEYHELIGLLREQLQQTGTITYVEYVGSVYKKTMVPGSDFDNSFIKRDTSITKERSGMYPEYVFLKDRYDRVLDPLQTLREFKGTVQKILNKQGLNSKATLADHGPAIELRYRDGPVSFSVDLVFYYEIADGESYAAKPPQGATGRNTQLWKYSTTSAEKKRMQTIDKDNTVCRWVIRTIKGGFAKDAPLRVLSSFVIEESLFFLRDKHPDVSFWREPNLKTIIREMFLFMADAVECNSLSNYDNPNERNVLPPMSQITRSNVAQRLRALSKDHQLDTFIANA